MSEKRKPPTDLEWSNGSDIQCSSATAKDDVPPGYLYCELVVIEIALPNVCLLSRKLVSRFSSLEWEIEKT
jgi:hypothetical protein